MINVDGTVYLTQYGYKLPIPSAEIFRSNRFRFRSVVPANDADRVSENYSQVDWRGGSLLNLDGGIYFLTIFDDAVPFPEESLFTQMGYRFDNVIDVNDDSFADYERFNSFAENKTYSERVDELNEEIKNYIEENTPDEEETQEEESLSEDPVAARDAERIAKVRQTMTALELFYYDNGSYPDESPSGYIKMDDGIDGAKVSNYISAIPVAPTPADGACTLSQNTFIYNGRNSSDTANDTTDPAYYRLYFCLGGITTGLSAGVHFGSPSGLQ